MTTCYSSRKAQGAIRITLVFLSGALYLSGCTGGQSWSGLLASQEISPASLVTHGYKVGKPYVIRGKRYTPREDFSYREKGIASWYGHPFHGRKTASGAVYDMNRLTAAHRTLPLPSLVRVTNLENGKTADLLVNDRGPFAHNRIIDVSRQSAVKLGFLRKGVTRVQVRLLPGASRALKHAARDGAKITAPGTRFVRTADSRPLWPLWGDRPWGNVPFKRNFVITQKIAARKPDHTSWSRPPRNELAPLWAHGHGGFRSLAKIPGISASAR